MHRYLSTALFTLSAAIPCAAAVDFVRDVRPIFEKHCHECHGEEKQKSGFRLDVKQEAFHSGEAHAPNLIPGKSANSPLFQFVSGAAPKMQMPPKSKGAPLTTEEVATLKQWIDEGAVWHEDADKVKLVDKTDWWSFKPLRKPDVPQVANPTAKITNEIDAFIVAKLNEHSLAQAPEADARTLIRRLSYDLTGLPPTPEEADAFQAAFARDPGTSLQELATSLLASPRHGERWARHWLDLVHYGETHGYDKDKPRNNAWPYRDYVIRAFNEDKPYARFVEEQIAGDALYPGTVDGVVALGFISAGPWDLIGHMEVPESKTDGMIARHLDRDDMVQNAMGAFCSLTAGCAQCHNHKFDPISQEDYYSLQAVFAALDRTDVTYYADDATMARYVALKARSKQLSTEIEALEAPLKARAGTALTDLDRRISGASDKASATDPNTKPDYGYHSAISPVQDATKWVQVDLGRACDISRVTLMPCHDAFNGIGGGFGFPVRFKVETSDDPDFKTGVTLLWRKHDQTFMNDYSNPGLRPFTTEGTKDEGTRGRYVRVTAVKLAPRKNDFIFALAELQVMDESGANVALQRPVTSLDSIEAAPRWRRANLTDGIAPEAKSPDEKKDLLQEREKLLLSFADETTRQRLSALRQQSTQVASEMQGLPGAGRVYAGAVHTGEGAFRGTGGSGGKPRTIHLLKRGDVKSPAQEVAPGTISALSQMHRLPGRFEASDAGGESTRRAALARWITSRDNPLFWRSIVNRVWQHHFGKPLVETANDFGRMGAQPSHPELLDWLAVTFRDDLDGSLKKLHKLIVMSHTYRQSSSPPDAGQGSGALSDAENRFLSHQNRRKLDAESVRDTALSIAGKLDLTMGGPGFQDFVITRPQHSPHYEYDLHDPEDPKSHRRSIYRFIVRSQQQPFMTCLDCADPSMRVDRRNESLSPLQALALMNNGLMVTMARHFATRLEQEHPGDVPAQIERAFLLTVSRRPTAEERAALAAHAKQHGLANTCRLVMNLNEAAFVD